LRPFGAASRVCQPFKEFAGEPLACVWSSVDHAEPLPVCRRYRGLASLIGQRHGARAVLSITESFDANVYTTVLTLPR